MPIAPSTIGANVNTQDRSNASVTIEHTACREQAAGTAEGFPERTCHTIGEASSITFIKLLAACRVAKVPRCRCPPPSTTRTLRIWRPLAGASDPPELSTRAAKTDGGSVAHNVQIRPVFMRVFATHQHRRGEQSAVEPTIEFSVHGQKFTPDDPSTGSARPAAADTGRSTARNSENSPRTPTHPPGAPINVLGEFYRTATRARSSRRFRSPRPARANSPRRLAPVVPPNNLTRLRLLHRTPWASLFPRTISPSLPRLPTPFPRSRSG
jgi:hypothetical protein